MILHEDYDAKKEWAGHEEIFLLSYVITWHKMRIYACFSTMYVKIYFTEGFNCKTLIFQITNDMRVVRWNRLHILLPGGATFVLKGLPRPTHRVMF